MDRSIRFLIVFILLVPPLVFFTDLTRNPYYFQIVLLNSCTALAAALWLAQGLRGKKLTVYSTPLDVPLLAFFAAATLSIIAVYAANVNEPYLRYSIFSEGSKRWLFLLVNVVLVFFIAAFYSDDDHRSLYVHVPLIVGGVAAAYGILQYRGVELIWPKVLNPFGGRSVSTFGNPNFLSSYLVLLFPPAFAYFLKTERGMRRALYGMLLLVYAGGMLCTLTRSSWLGVSVGMLFFALLLFFHDRQFFMKRFRWGVIAAAALLLTAVFWPKSPVEGYHPSVIERLAESKKAAGEYYAPWHQRRLIWSCAWHMVAENPVLGKGWGCFELYYPFYQGRHLFVEAYRNFRTHANNTHNEALEIWSQTGTIGMGIYLWFLVTLFTAAFKTMRGAERGRKLLAMALIASIAGMLTDNLLNVSLHFAVPGFLYWWFAGILAGLSRGSGRTVRLEDGIRKAAAAAGIVFAGFIIMIYIGHLKAEIHYFKGFKFSKQNDIRRAIPELEAAHRFQRFEVNNNYELANACARAHDIARALAYYEESLRANAGYDEIYFNMATVLAQKGDLSRSLREYTRALYINPISQEAYVVMSSIMLQDMQRYRSALIPLLAQGTLLFPGNKEMWNNLGYVHAISGNRDGAAAAYGKALELDPSFGMAKKNLESLTGRAFKAPAVNGTDLLMSRAEKAVSEKDWEKARPLLERLAQQNPDDPKIRLYLGNVYFTLGSLEPAVAQYSAALAASSNNVAALGNRALAYMAMRRYTEARRDFAGLLEREPENSLAREKLAEIDRVLSK